MGTDMNPDHFILCLAAALKSPDIVGQLKEITHPSRDELADLISSELHRQLKPLKDALEAKDREIKELKKTISDQNDKLDQLEQHGRRDSLRIAGIPENEASDDTDAAVLTLCAAIKVDPPVQAHDIAVSHRAGKAATGKPRQILVKFATRNIRERVFRAKKTSKLNVRKTSLWRTFTLMKTSHSTVPVWPERLASVKLIIKFKIPGQYMVKSWLKIYMAMSKLSTTNKSSMT